MRIIKYVLTNPDRDTKLESSDKVFVLAKSDPGDPERWDDYDTNKDIFDPNQMRIMTNINNM